MGLIFALSTFSSSLILSTKLFLFEVIPSIYFQMFTPLHLFLLLNLLIISILVITHLCKEAVPPNSLAPPHRSSSSSSNHQMHRLRANYADNQAKLFAGIMLSDDHGAAADHFMVREAEITVTRSAARSDHQMRRRGDRVVNAANPAGSVHSDDISAESFMSQTNNGYSAVLNDRCIYGRKANDPDLHHNEGVINDVINVEDARHKENAAHESKKSDNLAYYDKRGNLQGNQAVVKEVISEIKMGSSAEMDEQKAEYKPAENEKAAEHACCSADHDTLICSLDPVPESIIQEQERPLASTHFTSKKSTNRTHLEMLRSNSPLKVSRPSVKRGDTLDATWKAICENKSRHSSPLTRHHKINHIKKLDHHQNTEKTRDTNISKGSLLSPLSPSKQRHHIPASSSSGLMRKRELSIPRDELNARVESFISRFNQQIRIQREESLLNYRNMVARGAN